MTRADAPDGLDARVFEARGRRAAPAVVIEGQAVRLPRAPTRTRFAGAPVERMPARAEAAAAPPPRRPAARGETAGDLIFPRRGVVPVPRPAPAVPAAPARAGAAPRLAGGLAAGAFALAALAAMLPNGEVAATPAPGMTAEGPGSVAPSPVTLSDVVARVYPRGTGEVIAVEGVIANPSPRFELVPPMRLSLSEPDGTVRGKPVVPLGGGLAPGRTLRFQTMVAVPAGAGAAGEIGLSFGDPVS